MESTEKRAASLAFVGGHAFSPFTDSTQETRSSLRCLHSHGRSRSPLPQPADFTTAQVRTAIRTLIACFRNRERERRPLTFAAMKRSSSAPMIPEMVKEAIMKPSGMAGVGAGGSSQPSGGQGAGAASLSLQRRRGLSGSNVSLPGELARAPFSGPEFSPRRQVQLA